MFVVWVGALIQGLFQKIIGAQVVSDEVTFLGNGV